MENVPIFSVSDAIAVIGQTLDVAYPHVMVEGEVASFQVNQQKYVFFDIKDATGTLNCFMTVWQLRIPITDGMRVTIKATPKLTQKGRFSLTVQSIQPSGEGAIKKSFELLKKKLADEGLFAPERKRHLPEYPQRVAVISSTQAAGYKDFIKLIDERWGGMSVEVAQVRVQGDGAADQMIRAIQHFNQRDPLAELLVVIRGGGSADDLAAFNDELLVRAVAGSRIPVVTGVGHESDESLVDLAADVRAATPSHAAQMITPDRQAVARQTTLRIDAALDRIEERIDDEMMRIRDVVDAALDRTEQAIEGSRARVAHLEATLAHLDPRRVLERGYAIVRGARQPGSTIQIEEQQGILTAKVESYEQR